MAKTLFDDLKSNTLLPPGYTQLEYIESTGTQYIDTGVNADNNLGYEMHINFGTTARWGTIKNLNNGSYLRHHNYNNYYHFGNPSYTILNQNDITIKLDTVNLKIYSNGTAQNITAQTFDTELNYWLFARNSNDSTLQNYSSGKVYYCKLYKTGKLVRDFIPAKRDYDSKPGLYDIVTNVFYINAGTGEFTIGPEIIELPNEYEKVDYIESTGTQYIDTGVIPSNGFGFEVDVIPLTNVDTTSSSAKVFGSSKKNNGYWGGVQIGTYASKTGGQMTWFKAASNSNFYDPGFISYTRCQMKNINNHFTSSTGKSYDTPYSIDDNINGSLYLFAINQDEGITFGAGLRMYSCKLYNSEKVIRNFIPAIRKSDSKPGLYDLVNNAFYFNSGTGEFKYPSNNRIPNDYQEVEYIEGNGSVYIGEISLDSQIVSGNLTVGYKFTATSHTAAMYFSTIVSNQSAGQAYSLGYTTSNSPLYIRFNQVANSSTEVTYTLNNICEITRTNSVSNVRLDSYSLFCHSASYAPWKGRCYYYYLKIDETYIFNLVPCYKKSNGQIGLYDLVKNKFYTAASGTFTKGNDINLPEIYQELEYIESTGTQYINTGYVTTGTEVFQFETTLEFTTYDASDLGIGGNNGYGYGANVSTHKFWWGETLADLNRKYKISFFASTSARYGVVDDIKYSTSAYPYANQQIILFGRGNASGIQLYSIYKLYSFKLFVNSVLIRNFIPCYRKSDNIIGLYDLVNGVFYTNSGTGTFLKGREINRNKTIKALKYNNKNVIRINDGTTGFNIWNKRPEFINRDGEYITVPHGYKAIDYIESTGTQGIALGYNATQNTEFEITFMRTGSTGDSNQWILAGYNGGSNPQCTITHNSARFKDGSGNGANYSITTTENTLYSASYHNKVFIMNGTNYGTTASQNNFTTQNLTLFEAGRGSALRFPSICRIYKCKVWSNSSTLIRDMLPCYRISDGVAGMYDLVNQKFYSNLYTGDDFIKGDPTPIY